MMRESENIELACTSAQSAQESLAEDLPKNLNDKIIYECYKPRNLRDAREYARLILAQRRVLPNEVEDFSQESAAADGSLEGQVSDTDFQQMQTAAPSLKSYFAEYAARAESTLLPHVVDRP